MLRVLICHKFVSGSNLHQSYTELVKFFVYKIFLFYLSIVETSQELVVGLILYLIFSEIIYRFDKSFAIKITVPQQIQYLYPSR